jgi:putative hemolysin
VIFPAGAVSTAGGPFGKRALDAEWKPFTARAIIETRASVLPVFFGGRNSRLFQIASHVSQTLREALLFHEMRNKAAAGSGSGIGRPLGYPEIAHLTDRHRLTRHLRDLTYALDQGGPPRPRRRVHLRLRPRRDQKSTLPGNIAGPG